MHTPPNLVLVAGPNGAGKSTTAEALLVGALAVEEFVNADVIARGLSGFGPSAVAVAAGRILLRRIRQLAEERASFAFETTLASRSLAPWLRELAASGYLVHIVYLTLPSPEVALLRVRQRVEAGGHDIPPETVRRRYGRSLDNLFRLYLPLATSWRLYDNGDLRGPRLVSRGRGTLAEEVRDEDLWRRLHTAHAHGAREARAGDARAAEDDER